MSIFWLILKILAWVLLGILALVVVALFIPATVEIRYEHKRNVVRLRYLFFRFVLHDSGAVKKKKEAVPSEEAEPTAVEKTVAKFDFNLIKQLLRPGTRAARMVIKRLYIHDVQVIAVAEGKDPAEVGINAGRIWAAVGVVMGLIHVIWQRVQYTELTVIPDFSGTQAAAEKYSCKVTAIPVIIGIAGTIFLIRYAKIMKEHAPVQPDEAVALANEAKAG